jgi:hypothetical protein
MDAARGRRRRRAPGPWCSPASRPSCLPCDRPDRAGRRGPGKRPGQRAVQGRRGGPSGSACRVCPAEPDAPPGSTGRHGRRAEPAGQGIAGDRMAGPPGCDAPPGCDDGGLIRGGFTRTHGARPRHSSDARQAALPGCHPPASLPQSRVGADPARPAGCAAPHAVCGHHAPAHTTASASLPGARCQSFRKHRRSPPAGTCRTGPRAETRAPLASGVPAHTASLEGPGSPRFRGKSTIGHISPGKPLAWPRAFG